MKSKLQVEFQASWKAEKNVMKSNFKLNFKLARKLRPLVSLSPNFCMPLFVAIYSALSMKSERVWGRVAKWRRNLVFVFIKFLTVDDVDRRLENSG